MKEMKIHQQGAFGTLLVLQVIFIVIYALLVKYKPAAEPRTEGAAISGTSDNPNAKDLEELDTTYPLFQDIHVMIFVGFGFLVTFLKKYAHSGVGFTFLVAALAIEWAILINGFFHWDSDHKIYLGIEEYAECAFSFVIHLAINVCANALLATVYHYQFPGKIMILADEAAATVLISLGIVLGKVSPFGLIFMTLIEIVAYVGNEYLCVEKLEAMDWGGSVYLHAFGAYFGLGMSIILALKTKTLEEKREESASYFGDVTAMIGTLFLWLFWPSFLAAGFTGELRYRIIINTYLALLSSCIAVFAMSSALNKRFKFKMDQIQNATLAGGVAIGTTCVAMIYPYGAMIIGGVSGAVSSLGFAYIQGFLRHKCHIHDTCGAHNLHGMPGILGGISGVLTAAFADRKTYGSELDTIFPAMANGRSVRLQVVCQVSSIFVSLAIASLSGILSGAFVRYVLPPIPDEVFYKDEEWWDEEEEEENA